MTRYSVQRRDRIFVKGYGFLCFAKNMGRNIGKNISKNLSSKYSQKCIGHAKQMHLKLIKKCDEKQQKQLGTLLEKNLLIKLQEPQKLHQRKNEYETIETNE